MEVGAEEPSLSLTTAMMEVSRSYNTRTWLASKFIDEDKVDMHHQCEYGQGMMHYAADGKRAMLQHLLEHDGSTSIVCRRGMTPLHRAALRGDVAGIRVLLAHGARVDATDRRGDTPLHKALCNGLGRRNAGKAAEVLIKAGSNVNKPNNAGFAPIHAAILAGHSSKVLMKLKALGADMTQRTGLGQTPYQLAGDMLYGWFERRCLRVPASQRALHDQTAGVAAADHLVGVAAAPPVPARRRRSTCRVM